MANCVPSLSLIKAPLCLSVCLVSSLHVGLPQNRAAAVSSCCF